MLSDDNQMATSKENMCMIFREKDEALAWKTWKSQGISSSRYSMMKTDFKYRYLFREKYSQSILNFDSLHRGLP